MKEFFANNSKIDRVLKWLFYGEQRKKWELDPRLRLLLPWYKRSFIDHDSTFRKFWDIIIAILLIFLCITLPFLLAYNDSAPSNMQWIENMIDIFFIIDIPINFLSTIETEKGTQDEILEVAKIYTMSGWFFIDFVSVIPPSYLGLGPQYGFIKAIKLMRISKLKRLLPQIQTHFEIKNSHLSIVKFTIMILLAGHWCGCFFYMVAAWQGYPASSWVNVYMNGSSTRRDQPPMRKFMSSFYWAITMMSTIGFGDVTPGTTWEILYCIFSMCFGTAIFAYSVTNMCTVVFGMDLDSGKFAGMQDRMKHLLEHQGIGPKLKKKIRKYLLFKFHCSTIAMFDAFAVLDNLSTDLREEVLQEFCNTLFDWIDILHMFGPRFVRLMAFHLEGQVYNCEEVIMLAGTKCNRTYILSAGEVEVLYNMRIIENLESIIHPLSPKQQDEKKNKGNILKQSFQRMKLESHFSKPENDHIEASSTPWHHIKKISAKKRVLTQGCSFNEVACLLAKPSTLTVFALKHVDIYSFSRDSYMDLLAQHYPNKIQSLFKNLIIHEKKIGVQDFSLNLKPPEYIDEHGRSSEADEVIFSEYSDIKPFKMETLKRNMLFQKRAFRREWSPDNEIKNTFENTWCGTEGFLTNSIPLSAQKADIEETCENYKCRPISDILLGLGSGIPGTEVKTAAHLIDAKIDALQSIVDKDNNILKDLISNFRINDDHDGRLSLAPLTLKV